MVTTEVLDRHSALGIPDGDSLGIISQRTPAQRLGKVCQLSLQIVVIRQCITLVFELRLPNEGRSHRVDR